MLESGIHRSQQITQLVDEAGQHRPGVGRDQFIEPVGITPPGPWTINCIRNAPPPSASEPLAKAHSGMTGSASRAAIIIALRRPIFSDSEPKNTPPMIEAML